MNNGAHIYYILFFWIFGFLDFWDFGFWDFWDYIGIFGIYWDFGIWSKNLSVSCVSIYFKEKKNGSDAMESCNNL